MLIFFAMIHTAVSISTWSQLGDTIDDSSITVYQGCQSSTEFGTDVLINHNATIIAVGDRYFCNHIGRVTVFRLEDSVWTQMGEVITGPESGDSFGSENRIAMNAAGNILSICGISNGGRFYIYEWDGTDWNQKGNAIDNYFNTYTTALNDAGDIVAVGTVAVPDRNVQVFQWDSTNWVQMGQTITPPFSGSDYWGYSLDINGAGDVIVVGDQTAYNNDATGDVSVTFSNPSLSEQ